MGWFRNGFLVVGGSTVCTAGKDVRLKWITIVVIINSVYLFLNQVFDSWEYLLLIRSSA